MLSVESNFRLCMKGELLHHYKRRSKKKRFAEIHVSAGEVEAYDFKAGYVIMTYSDKMDAKITNRCQIHQVVMDKSNGQDFAFTISAMVAGADKDLKFSCETSE